MENRGFWKPLEWSAFIQKDNMKIKQKTKKIKDKAC